MPWNVRLEDEDGGVVDEVFTIFGFIPGNEHSIFCLIEGIDPYGDTVFNRPQMKRFMDEWQKLENAAKIASQLEKWIAVKSLARRCQSEPHTYLRFVGD
jgi:hypothetical protein